MSSGFVTSSRLWWRRRPRYEKFAIVGTSALAMVVMFLFFFRAADVQPSGVRLPAVKVQRPSPIAEKMEPLLPTKRTDPAPDPEPAKSAPEEKRAANREYNSTDSSTDWAVVAVTYKVFGQAQQRADSLKSQWSKCACKVYPPGGESNYFFVLIGSGLDRNAADRLRDNAVAAGLPGDSYVTRLLRSQPEPEKEREGREQ